MSNLLPTNISAKTILTQNLSILPLHHLQAVQLQDYYLRNREFLKQTSPCPAQDFYTEEYWQRKIWQSRQDWQSEKSALFVITQRSEQELVIGSVNFNQVIRGVMQSCFLGYSIDQDYQSKGLMTEALEGLIEYMFCEWRLHRIQANYLVSNSASARVLEKLGFEKEGLAKKYLKINGSWQDHILTAKINSDTSI